MHTHVIRALAAAAATVTFTTPGLMAAGAAQATTAMPDAVTAPVFATNHAGYLAA